MAFVPNFTAVSVSGYPNKILFTDTSQGSDGAITSRRIYISDNAGNFIVVTGTATQYNLWPLPLSTAITLALLTKDYAVSVVVQWLNVSNAVLYDKTIQYGFTLYNETFDYGLTTLLAANPLLINDNRFFSEKSELREAIDSGNNALSLAADLYNAQQAYDRATAIRLSSQYYFNENG